MQRSGHLPRLAFDIVTFFLIFTILMYLFGVRDSVISSAGLGIFTAVVYGVVTYVLRQRTIRNQQNEER